MNDQPNGTNVEMAPNVEVQTPKSQEADLYLMFKQIESLRQDGVSEEVIREAFNQLMSEKQGNYRKVQLPVKNPDSTPMPTQEEINKMYEERYKDLPPDVEMSPTMKEIYDGIQLAKEANSKILKRATLFGTIKMYWYRTIYFFLSKFLSLVVWVVSKMGVK